MSDPCKCVEGGECKCSDSCAGDNCRCDPEKCKCKDGCACSNCKVKCKCSGTCDPACGKNCTGPKDCKCPPNSCPCNQ
uniref:Metallothionein n=1 Tax=Tegillarca granosa TaxID=220873 RepID=Q6Q0Z1_TEGGR|nr:metallothionein [Tegillarca granosa]